MGTPFKKEIIMYKLAGIVIFASIAVLVSGESPACEKVDCSSNKFCFEGIDKSTGCPRCYCTGLILPEELKNKAKRESPVCEKVDCSSKFCFEGIDRGTGCPRCYCTGLIVPEELKKRESPVCEKV